MTLQTFTIQEAESQFRFWLNRILSSQQSVMLTTDDAQEPMALVMPVAADNDDDGHNMFVRHVELLEAIVPLWQQELVKELPAQDFAGLYHTQLRILSDRIPEDLSTFASAVMLLRLAARTLKEAATIDKLAALLDAFSILKKIELTIDDLDEIDQILLDAGLDIQADLGDPDLMNAYIDAL